MALRKPYLVEQITPKAMVEGEININKQQIIIINNNIPFSTIKITAIDCLYIVHGRKLGAPLLNFVNQFTLNLLLFTIYRRFTACLKFTYSPWQMCEIKSVFVLEMDCDGS